VISILLRERKEQKKEERTKCVETLEFIDFFGEGRGMKLFWLRCFPADFSFPRENNKREQTRIDKIVLPQILFSLFFFSLSLLISNPISYQFKQLILPKKIV